MTKAPEAASAFPAIRMRRNRRTAWSRAMVRENTLTPHDLIWPVFVIEGQNRTEEVSSMPGVTRYSVDLLIDKVKEAADLGIPAVALFPNTPRELRTADAREAFNPGQPRLPGGARHPEGGAGNRHHVRRGARSLHQPWP